MSNDVEEVKRRINLVDLIASYLPLKKSGSGWKGACPFHQEKTPSFHVNVDRQIFKCFGCAESGDAIDFVMKMEHLTFPEGLQLLADRVGVILDKRKTPEVYAKEKDEKSRLYRINRLSMDVYAKILTDHPQGKAAREYLLVRGLTEETIQTFRLGYAPASVRGLPSVLEKFLTNREYTFAERKLAGSPERFSHRIIFPLWDTLGNVVGFTGRALDPADQPKYLNTPETPIFKKSRLLYPLHVARDAIKETQRVVIVEGQMDVLLSHQLGTKEVVATSGTALTRDHLEILGRYTPKLIFAFDNDAAGIEATRKALLLAYELELEPSVATLPQKFKDLGELGLAEPQLWPETLANAEPGFAWQLRLAVAAQPDTRTASAKKQIAKLTLPLLSRMNDVIERGHWVQVLARTIQTPERTILEALDRVASKDQARPSAASDPQEKPASQRRRTLAETVLGLVFLSPNDASRVIPKLTEVIFIDCPEGLRVVEALKMWYSQGGKLNQTTLFEAVKGSLSRDDGIWLASLIDEIEQSYAESGSTGIRTELDATIVRLQEREREGLKETIADKIRDAEARGDRAEVKKLLEEFQQMLKGNTKS